MFEKSHAGSHEGPRPWLRKLIYSDAALDVPEIIRVESVAFEDGEPIPGAFRRRWREGLAAFALARRAGRRRGHRNRGRGCGQPDARALRPRPGGQDARDGRRSHSGALTREAAATEGFLLGLNSLGEASWTPPDPPPGTGPHRYVFQMFAIDHRPEFAAAPDRREILGVLRDHALAKGCVSGIYERVA